MNMILYCLIALACFFLMEGVSWFMHKYVMHGFLWYLHKDHHQSGKKIIEKNDLFFLIFAIPGWLCVMLGWRNETWWVVSVGAGITLYGVAYFVVHEIIIHQRFKLFTKSNTRYIKAMRWAHKMHHRHLNKENGESFGMLFIARKYWEKIKRDEEIRQSINHSKF
jgi:beta-carotene 3-hydroxylase